MYHGKKCALYQTVVMTDQEQASKWKNCEQMQAASAGDLRDALQSATKPRNQMLVHPLRPPHPPLTAIVSRISYAHILM